MSFRAVEVAAYVFSGKIAKNQALKWNDNRTEGMAMNILDFAMKMELDGKAYYEKLAAETPVAGLKSIFTTLAADEQKHHDIIRDIKSGTNSQMANSVVLEKAKNLFEELAADKAIVDSLKKSLDGYQHARKIEADSVRFYEDMAKKEANPETVQLLLRIANEEKKHFNIMDNLYDYVLAPQNFLAWGEFSNLKEF
jgi:rubrerythrin